MADKKVRKILDGLRGDIQELAESFAEFRDQTVTQTAIGAAERQKQADQAASSTTATTAALEAMTLSSEEPGYISAFGYFDAPSDGDHQTYRWSMEEAPIQEVLAFPVDHFAPKLAAIGHAQRLGILLMLIGKPATANDIVQALALGTTGAAYHHLNVLQAAGLVQQQQRGRFSFIPDQVPVLLTILSALSGNIAADITAPPDESSAELEAYAPKKQS